jgi:NAD(P)-dependent dehydrogenase (short-subunit alcohol dehydrogenase family)
MNRHVAIVGAGFIGRAWAIVFARAGFSVAVYDAVDTALAQCPPEKGPHIDWSHPFAQRFQAAMNEDFGTPDAVAVLFDLASDVNRTQSASLAQLLKSLDHPNIVQYKHVSLESKSFRFIK